MTRDEALSILKLPPNPTTQDILKAYRALSMKYHPDLYQTSDDAVKEVMHEKFLQITAAKEFLLSSQSDSSTSNSSGQNYGQSAGNDFNSDYLRAEAFLDRRQFTEALNVVNGMLRKYGKEIAIFELRSRIYFEQEDFTNAYQDLLYLEHAEPAARNDADFQHVKAVYAASAHHFEDALFAIDNAIRLIRIPAPTFLATKANIFIMQGRTAEADQIIQILARHDPNHPLVRERQRYFNVGGNYVEKDRAAGGACLLCTVLECIFDCC
ncbi:MAG: J domain-containing protein [Bacteroidetes bacterium]|nr:J domain-containing protein [Bacteroidota bacterium]